MTLRKTAKWLAHSYCPGLTGRFRYFGTRVFFPHGAWIFRLACEQGIYESEILTLIQGLVTAESWFFDVGANIGLMSVPLLKQRPDVKVLSFEPSLNSAPYLLRTWQHCPWRDRWEIRSMAVGQSKSTAEFSFGPRSLGGYDGLKYTKRVAQAGTHVVQVTTLDDEWVGLGRPQVSFIKLDIEGAEIDALNASAGILSECRPYIILEWYKENFTSYGRRDEDLFEFATRFAYEVVAIPTMSVVNTEPLLRAMMVRTSAFLLAPLTLTSQSESAGIWGRQRLPQNTMVEQTREGP